MTEPPRPIGETAFELSQSDRKMWVRVFAPALEPNGETWGCVYAIDAPLSVERQGFGETSLLALVEALRGISRAIYGSAEYRDKHIGLGGKFGANLYLPATFDLLDIAPYPF
jgi:hypothetical protein